MFSLAIAHVCGMEFMVFALVKKKKSKSEALVFFLSFFRGHI